MTGAEVLQAVQEWYQWIHANPILGFGGLAVLMLGLGIGVGALKHLCGFSAKKKTHTMRPGQRCPTCGRQG